MSNGEFEAGQSSFDRRALVKRLAVGAFAVPAIVAFKLDSLARAGTRGGGHDTKHDPKHSYPNQTEPNQTDCEPDHSHPNQTLPDSTSEEHPPKPPREPKPPKPPKEPKPPKPPDSDSRKRRRG